MKTNKTTKIILVLIAIALLGGFVYFFIGDNDINDGQVGGRDTSISETRDEVPVNSNIFEIEAPEGVEIESPIDVVADPTPIELPVVEKKSILEKVVDKVTQTVEDVHDTYISKANVLYNVPFTSQAPFSNWNPPYDEACEEASMIMAYYYFNNLTINNDIADEEILKQVAWQEINGYTIDINAAEVNDVLKKYYGLTSSLIQNPTVEDIQKSLDGGSLVIIPAAGRMLGNPNFTSPGPVYHMLVVIGYDTKQREFITNDPGTRNGEHYRYDFDVFMNAIHDWNGGDVNNGQKVVVVVSK